MKDRCEALRTCRAGRAEPTQCRERAEFVRDGRRVCWSHKKSLTVRFYVDAAVPLETILRVKTSLENVRRRQRIKELKDELVRRQKRDKPKVCLLCANLAWRRAKPACHGCGLPHADEPLSSMSPLMT